MKGAGQLVLIDKILPKYQIKSQETLKDIFLVLSFSFLTALCAKLKLEIGAVPITMQTFAVLLSGAFLGAKRGALSQLIYLFGGLLGIPWFSRGGGVGYIMSPTFGYIIGFVFSAYLVGFLCERGFDRNIKTAILAMILGNILIYIFGALWLLKFMAPSKVLLTGIYPFIFGDLLKILLAGILLPTLWKIIKRSDIQ